MKIEKIYDKYQIMPQLRTHLFRVAAVIKFIALNAKKELDIEDMVVAGLLHDMGNIIKFDLTLYPESLEPEGLPYWEKVQHNFREKYGPDEHTATYKIAEEIGVSKRIFDLLLAFGFGHAEERASDPNLAKKICQYADCRVAPDGVVSLKTREFEGRKRYLKNKKIIHSSSTDEENFMKLVNAMEIVEEQVFSLNEINPEDINDESISDYFKEVQNFDLTVGKQLK